MGVEQALKLGVGTSRPDFSRIPAAMRDNLVALRVPRPLLDRYRPSPPALEARMSALGGAASLEHKLLQRTTLGATVADLEEIEALGRRDYLERQLHPESIDDGGLEEALLGALPSLAMTPWEQVVTYYEEEPFIPAFELLVATFFRSIYSPRQLFERMAIFWTDHLNIHLFSDIGIFLKPKDDRDVVRRHALGTFPDLLRASARSSAMLGYLTNDSNVRGHPNENYARELMELHTLGVDGGYTEEDVKEVARCFTGWAFWGPEAGPELGEFFFNPAAHDFGAKTVLGHHIPAGGGVEDGERVLDILLAHPSTARFIAGKLLRYLWGYAPRERAVDRLAKVYLDTAGDIPAMLRAALAWSLLATGTPKLKRPYHLMVSSLRALFAGVQNPFFLFESLLAAGHVPFDWPPPNGYPDSAGYWAGLVVPRWNFAAEAFVNEAAGVELDLPFLDPSLPPEQMRLILDLLLLGGTMTPQTSQALGSFLAASPPTQKTVREAIGLTVSSPEFQHY